MKRIISLFLSFVLIFTCASVLASCGGSGENNGGVNEGIPGDGGGTSEGDNTGGAAPSPMLDLIKDKVARFSIITDQKDAAINAAADEWIAKLADYGIEVKRYADYSVNKMQDCEILIGDSLVQRDKYAVDTHDFGEKGYVIRVIDQKVVICGGNTDSTVEALTLFFENYVGINVATDDVVNVSISQTLEVLKVQDDYPIKNLTVNGESIKDVYISASRSNSYAFAAAQELQAAIYTNAGAWLEIMYLDGDTSARVKLEVVENAGEDGFRVFVDTDGNLTLHCAYKNAFAKGVTRFVNNAFASAGESLNFDNSYEYTTNVSVVKYSEFGAKGTGGVDDYEAIVAAHAYANEGGQRVEADKGATYYIGSHRKTAVIKTDVDWKDAKFIIDDRRVSREDSDFWLFSVRPDRGSYNVKIPEGYSLKTTDTNVGLKFDSKVLLHVQDTTKRAYIRYGGNANNGYTLREVIIVDEEGNIDPLTPLVFDYDKVTSLTAYPIEDKPLLIQGGEFTTYANVGGNASKWCGYKRGIQVLRSNTTVYNVAHYVEKEPPITDEASKEASCPYSGFLYAQFSTNVLFDSCVVTGHLAYQHGTYDIGANLASGVTWKNCTQSNDFEDNTYWGVMGSNFSKNLTFDGCELSRFDAHEGVHNATIINSKIGVCINLVGTGNCLIENVHLSGANNNFFIHLRQDYGSTWNGDITIKNCKMTVKDSHKSAYVLKADWHQHDFGYECHLPNLYIDGFEVEFQNGSSYNQNFYIFKKMHNSDLDYRLDEINPLYAPEFITLLNIKNSYKLVQNTYEEKIFSQTTVKTTKDE